jgi:hypothetical protein
VVGGLAWDVVGLPVAAFIPMAICALVLATLPLTIDFARRAK